MAKETTTHPRISVNKLAEFVTAKADLANSGEAHGPLCYVIDVGSKLVHPGVKAIASRMKEISANCRNICAIWPTISPDD